MRDAALNQKLKWRYAGVAGLLKNLSWSLMSLSLVCLVGCQHTPTSLSKPVTRSLIEDEMRTSVQDRSQAVPPQPVMAAVINGEEAENNKAKVATLDKSGPARRIDVHFDLVFNNASINQVFAALAEGSRYSFIMPPGLTQSVTVNLHHISLPDALEVLSQLYGFEYRVSGSRVYVEPPTLQTRIFQVAYPTGKRSGASDTRVVSGSLSNPNGTSNGSPNMSGNSSATMTSSITEGSQVTTSTEADFWKELETSLKAIVGSESGRQIVLSQHSGVLVVRALPKEIRDIEAFLRSSKLSIERQVMLEAKIVEVTLKEGHQSGINWASLTGAGNHRVSVGADPSRIYISGSVGRNSGLEEGAIKTIIDPGTTPPSLIPSTVADLLTTPLSAVTGGLMGIAFSTDNFYGLLAFLETQGEVHVLSSPRIAAINNQKAVLRVGTDDFFVTNISTTTTTSASGTVTTPTISVQPFFSGISLDVTPQIDINGVVTMHVRPSVSNVVEKTHVVDLGTLGNFRLPLASSTVNETDTIVRVQDGNIVAIGGLMQQEQGSEKGQVPVLGDVPIIGSLFKQNNRSFKKSELVFLIKPTVIKTDNDWRQDLAQTQERIRNMQFPTHTIQQRLGGE